MILYNNKTYLKWSEERQRDKSKIIVPKIIQDILCCIQTPQQSFNRHSLDQVFRKKYFKKKESVVDQNRNRMVKFLRTQSTQHPEIKFKKRRFGKPLSKEQIVEKCVRRFQKKYQKPRQMLFEDRVFCEQKNEDRNQLLKRNKIDKNILLLGNNIKEIQQKYPYDRFELHEIYSSFKSLLVFSEGKKQKFIIGFQQILNFHKLFLKQQTVVEKAKQIMQNFSFQNYLLVFNQIQRLNHQMTIIDYLQIILQSCPNQIKYHELHWAFRKRCNQQDSKSNSQYIFKKLGADQTQFIQKQDIMRLCCSDINLQTSIYALYLKQIKLPVP